MYIHLEDQIDSYDDDGVGPWHDISSASENIFGSEGRLKFEVLSDDPLGGAGNPLYSICFPIAQFCKWSLYSSANDLKRTELLNRE